MTLNIDLSNYRALVTGVSSGIGAGVAEALAKAGSDVAGCGIESADSEGAKRFIELVEGQGPHLAENIHHWNHEAALSFPMVYKGKVLGTLNLSFSQPLPFSTEDQEYLLTLARQAAQAFERARVETTMRLDAAMMENVPAGVYLVHASDGTILHTNPQLDKLFGYEPGEIIGKPVSVLNAENEHSPQEVADGIIEILRKEGSWQGEILSKRRDGTTFWCYGNITTFEHDTHGTVWVAARQDISERKQMEEALGESEQRYRAIVSQATAGIVRKDESGRLLCRQPGVL